MCDDFIPDNDKISDCSDSDDEDDDEVVENYHDTKEEDNTSQDQPMLLTQPPLTSPRGRNNVANVPSRKFKCIKPSMINAAAEHNKVKTDILSKTKNELRKLVSKFKDTHTCTNEDYSVSNWNALVA